MVNEVPARPGRPAYLAWLPRFLFETDPFAPRYVARAWLLALLPSIALSALVRLVAADAAAPQFPGEAVPLVLLVVFVGPALETLLLALPVLGLDRLFGPGPAVIGSALIWAVLHSLAVPTWGLVIWWPFLVMSIAFLTWRREGLLWAMGVAFAIHALQNGFAVGLMLLAG
jgi:membrane protease YdiL (CAAX protease family)